MVTPCVGVWIETGYYCTDASYWMSHPAWVCGLKPLVELARTLRVSHTLRGCVD